MSALITIRTPLYDRYTKQIVDLAIKNRLPSMYERSDYVEAGGLMSYSADDAENYRRAAYYVDRILKGTKPADLPVEQPMKFEFVINLKTAKQIGVTIPPEVLGAGEQNHSVKRASTRRGHSLEQTMAEYGTVVSREWEQSY